MKIKSLLLALATTATAYSYDLDTLTDLTGQIESSHNCQAIGDKGLAIGEFQFHADAWEQTSTFRKSLGKKVYGYDKATDKVIATDYCKDYLQWLANRLEARLHREPTNWEIYASFNRGIGSFAKIGYSFAKLPSWTQRSCRLIANETGETL